MTTMTPPITHAASVPARKSTLSHLLRACRLEDGARWALIGAVFAAAVVVLLAV